MLIHIYHLKKQRKLTPSKPEERNTITIEFPEGTEEVLGKKVSELQENVKTDEEGKITGKLLHITNYKGFSNKTDEQSGNYLVFKVKEATEGKKVTCKLSEAKSKGTVTLDQDGIVVYKITAKTQTITVEIDGNSKVLDLTQIELGEAV